MSKAISILIGMLALLARPALAADVALTTPAAVAPSGMTVVLTTEDAVLSTGFRLHADRHELDGDRVLL